MNIYTSPMHTFSPSQVEEYWQALITHDTLKFRLCDIDNPAWPDVQTMIANMGKQMYHVFDRDRNEIVADFMLENFTGKAAQIHFSMHPKNEYKYSLCIARKSSNHVLRWKSISGATFLETIYGLTPTSNRVACLFVLKAKFKKIGVLPAGIKDRGKIVDAMLTIKTRHNAIQDL